MYHWWFDRDRADCWYELMGQLCYHYKMRPADVLELTAGQFKALIDTMIEERKRGEATREAWR